MIDHTGFTASDFPVSLEFWRSALEALGYRQTVYVAETLESGAVAAFTAPGSDHAEFWLHQGVPGSPPHRPGLHIAFTASSPAAVEAFHAAAIAAGGVDNGAPGLRPDHAPDYYAAFVLDPDGHNAEAVCRQPA